VKRTYLKYLAVPEAMVGRLSEGDDSDSEGRPMNQDLIYPLSAELWEWEAEAEAEELIN
jgi:hypothetical protein